MLRCDQVLVKDMAGQRQGRETQEIQPGAHTRKSEVSTDQQKSGTTVASVELDQKRNDAGTLEWQSSHWSKHVAAAFTETC